MTTRRGTVLILVIVAIVVFAAVCIRSVFGPVRTSLEHADVSTARSQLGLYLPNDAIDICAFQEVGGLQSLDSRYRFHVGKERLDSAVEEIVRQCDEELKLKYDYDTQPISPSVSTWRWCMDAKLKWWTPGLIKDGYFKGTDRSYGLRIWVDRERELVFVQQDD